MKRALLGFLLLYGCQIPPIVEELSNPLPTIKPFQTPMPTPMAHTPREIDLGIIVIQTTSPTREPEPLPSPSKSARVKRPQTEEAMLAELVASLLKYIPPSVKQPAIAKVLPLLPYEIRREPKKTEYKFKLVSNAFYEKDGESYALGSESMMTHLDGYGFIGHSTVKSIRVSELPVEVLAELRR
ncbi:MAG: hypothetical protein CVV27_03635 [Candidatus Melainabacteria bacterium HGW-Melainabacteria-1]|nr:MAG: hypothetical protein CVV27_03635 [Candidatus Melainabacteria bacterium HGW-Melainabacteria-1]